MAKRNFRATLDVTPSQLPMVAALLPSGYAIAGSETMMGVVRLVLEGAGVTQDEHLQLVETDEGAARSVALQAAPNKPPTNA